MDKYIKMTTEEKLDKLTELVLGLAYKISEEDKVKEILFFDYLDLFFKAYKLPKILKRKERKAQIREDVIDSKVPALKLLIENYIKKDFPNKMIYEFTPIEINILVSKYSNISKTQKQICDFVKNVFSKAFLDGYIKKDISNAIEKIRHISKKIPPLSESQRKKFLKAIELEPLDKKILMLTYYFTGARLSELPKVLKVSDIDFKQALMHLKGTKTEIADRTIPLLGNLKFELKNYVELNNLLSNDYVFNISSEGVKSYFRRFCKKYKLSISHNQLRHTLATKLEEQGFSDTFIKYILGHANLRTQSIYKGVTSEYVKRVQKNFK